MRNWINEKETLLVSNDEITKTLNKHFAETAQKLNNIECPQIMKMQRMKH